MNYTHTLTFFATLLTLPLVHAQSYYAVCMKPVADLVGQSMASMRSENNLKKEYETLPLADTHRHGFVNRVTSYFLKEKQGIGCPRTHQLLFNEQVKVLQERGEEVEIELSNLFFITRARPRPSSRFWIHKSALMPLAQIPDPDKLPLPLVWKENNIDGQENCVTLAYPFDDPITGQLYSAGTRLVVTDEQPNTHTITVHIFDTRYNRWKTTNIPEELCMHSYGKTAETKIEDFVSLLSSWANNENGVLPFVWGGCSFTRYCQLHTCKEQKEITSKKETVHIYECKECPKKPHAGFDASGIILRAAQICGIPYHYKNSFTAARHLTPIQKGMSICEGDIISFPGTIAVISNIDENTIITAFGYSAGYGDIQEVKLASLFKTITTFDDLLDAYHTHAPVQVLKKDGTISRTVKNITIFSIQSLFIQ